MYDQPAERILSEFGGLVVKVDLAAEEHLNNEFQFDPILAIKKVAAPNWMPRPANRDGIQLGRGRVPCSHGV